MSSGASPSGSGSGPAPSRRPSRGLGALLGRPKLFPSEPLSAWVEDQADVDEVQRVLRGRRRGPPLLGLHGVALAPKRGWGEGT